MAEQEIIANKKILICDDDKAITSFLERFLKREGYTLVDISFSAEDALEKLKKQCYSLVFLDIALPGMSGIEALERIKKLDNKVAVIMITGFPELELAEKAMQMGAYDYIVKPFDLAYLKLVVLTKVLFDSK